MKTLNPFDAPGSLQADQRRARRERFRYVVWSIVVANALLLMGLLIQGCRRDPGTRGSSGGDAGEAERSVTNAVVSAPPASDTNAPVTPAFEASATNTTAEATVTNAPPTPLTGGTRQHVVVKGDSFSKIARANGISMKALAEANPGVESAKLKVGQVLQLPAGAAPSDAAPASAAAPVPAAAPRVNRYVVKAGDTLVRIAKAHATTVHALKAANGLTSNHIVVGQSLKMPQPGAASARRGTVSGDGPEKHTLSGLKA